VREASRRYDDPLVSVGVAPVAPQWCSDDLLASMRSLADDGLRLHSHLLESGWQRQWLDEDPVTRLARWGLLGPFLSVAHGVWLTSEELGQLAGFRVTPVHCPTSNAAHQVGAARVREWIDAGLVPALGLDSHEQEGQVDVFAEMRAAQSNAASRDAPLTAQEVLSMATTGGAAALGRAGELGCIQPGSSADLVLLDYPVAELAPDETVPAVVETGSPARVQSVYCAGSPVLQDGRGRTTVEAAEAREQLRQLLAEDAKARAERQRDIAPAVESLLNHLRQRAGNRPGSVNP
jgi:cytosine/adenosine deaminase-related metal-dependent hydrolase